MFTSSSFLLAAYIASETIRASYTYFAFHNFPQISASMVAVLSEATKLLVAASFLAFWTKTTLSAKFETLKPTQSSSTTETILQYAIPAALYLVNNLIYFSVLSHTTPILLHVCMLMTLPVTAILHHFMIKKQKNVFAWVSLALLCLGLVVFNVPSKSQPNSEHRLVRWYLAPVAGVIIACISALASINTEKLTKSGDFWASQACLYAFGVFFAVVVYPLVYVVDTGTNAPTDDHGDVLATLVMLVIVTSVTGLVVAAVLRARDNILKIIGIAASLITIAISQYFFLPELCPYTFTTWKICGGGIVCISTWMYNHYNKEQHQVARYLPVAEAQHHEHESHQDNRPVHGAERHSTGFFVPDATKVLACTLVVAFCTVEVAWRAI